MKMTIKNAQKVLEDRLKKLDEEQRKFARMPLPREVILKVNADRAKYNYDEGLISRKNSATKVSKKMIVKDNKYRKIANRNALESVILSPIIQSILNNRL